MAFTGAVVISAFITGVLLTCPGAAGQVRSCCNAPPLVQYKVSVVLYIVPVEINFDSWSSLSGEVRQFLPELQHSNIKITSYCD